MVAGELLLHGYDARRWCALLSWAGERGSATATADPKVLVGRGWVVGVDGSVAHGWMYSTARSCATSLRESKGSHKRCTVRHVPVGCSPQSHSRGGWCGWLGSQVRDCDERLAGKGLACPPFPVAGQLAPRQGSTAAAVMPSILRSGTKGAPAQPTSRGSLHPSRVRSGVSAKRRVCGGAGSPRFAQRRCRSLPPGHPASKVRRPPHALFAPSLKSPPGKRWRAWTTSTIFFANR
jgi:hypothetical protein